MASPTQPRIQGGDDRGQFTFRTHPEGDVLLAPPTGPALPPPVPVLPPPPGTADPIVVNRRRTGGPHEARALHTAHETPASVDEARRNLALQSTNPERRAHVAAEPDITRDQLLFALEDPDPTVRAAALTNPRSATGVPSLHRHLYDPDEIVAVAAASSPACTGAYNVLARAHPNPNVRAAAKHSAHGE